MKLRTTTISAITAIALIAQSVPASAHSRGWHGGGAWPIIGLAAVGTALVVGTAELLTAPVRAAAEAGNYPPQGYAPPPQAYAPAPAYYQQPPVYYAPQPVYYAPPPAYYGYGRGYYR